MLYLTAFYLLYINIYSKYFVIFKPKAFYFKASKHILCKNGWMYRVQLLAHFSLFSLLSWEKIKQNAVAGKGFLFRKHVEEM